MISALARIFFKISRLRRNTRRQFNLNKELPRDLVLNTQTVQLGAKVIAAVWQKGDEYQNISIFTVPKPLFIL